MEFIFILIGLIWFFGGIWNRKAIGYSSNYFSSGKYKPYDKSFSGYFLLLASQIIRADRIINKKELIYVEEFLIRENGYQYARWAMNKLQKYLQANINIADACADFSNRSYQHKLYMLFSLFGVALSDNFLHQNEEQLLLIISKRLNISNKDYASIKEMHTNKYRFGNLSFDEYIRNRTKYQNNFQSNRNSYYKKQNTQKENQNHQKNYKKTHNNYSSNHQQYYNPALQSAYIILGISSDVTFDELKKAYRKLVKKHHPDAVANLGDEHQKQAKEKFQQIQQAYEIVKKYKNF